MQPWPFSSFFLPAAVVVWQHSAIMHKERGRALLKQMLGPEAEFRDGQWEAIDRVANGRQRLLVVQRTGWGKSLVYFLAAKILRDGGAGPALLISPLLSLMRNLACLLFPAVRAARIVLPWMAVLKPAAWLSEC